MTARPWREAWEEALYGPGGFYLRPEGPGAHFRTASTASSSGLLGRALAVLAERCGCTSVVDVGAGHGELLLAVGVAAPSLRLVAVERAPRPDGLPAAVEWLADPPETMHATLLVGWELLDVVPCPVLEADPDGTTRQVLVAADGTQTLGDSVGPEDSAWCRRWWPVTVPGSRAEVGTARDELWSGLVSRLADGVALAVDYGHTLAHRPPAGTLTGFRAGRQVAPVPDGATDLTASVALDSLAAALPDGPDRLTWLLRQREALVALGLSGRRPDQALARSDPARYLARLAAAGEAAELEDASGLGGFGWVVHAVGGTATRGAEGLFGAAGWLDTARGWLTS
ncbi:MAG: SAM-dependent methyltransferase [Actinomycetes bacterium]